MTQKDCWDDGGLRGDREFCKGLGNGGKMLVAFVARIEDLNGANLSHA